MSGRDDETSGSSFPTPEEVAEMLLDAASSGNFARELAETSASLERRADTLEPLDRFRYSLLFFDLALVSTENQDTQVASAAALLTGAIEAGAPAWTAIRSSNRLNEIERLALDGADGLELLELLAYAPDEGMRGFAVSQIESAGMRALDNGIDTRRFERLLHAIGASGDAYRLEAARKQRTALSSEEKGDESTQREPPAFRVVALAGGHAQLRVTAARLLQRHGVVTVQIPSSREAVRRERDIVGLLQGCDLVLVLVRQITHSTSDQVRKASARTGVPLIYSNALSAVAIERQLFESER